MNKLGNKLKSARKSSNLSLYDVYKKTGITDTRLKRIEDGLKKDPSPKILMKLAELYNLNITELYRLADYLNTEQIKTMSLFDNIEYLNDIEIEHIQREINFLIQHRRKDDAS